MAATPDLDRAKIVDQQFISAIQSSNYPHPHSQVMPEEVGLDKNSYLELFQSQLISRHLDLQARVLKERGEGFYTIGSSGHEANAAVAKACKVDDIAFLHYRSGAFVIQRAKMKGVQDPIYDQLLSLVASSEDPISGGRHKVFGSLALNIPPQTSTIASHLPKAIGTAFSITLSKSLRADPSEFKLNRDGVVICSFGDGSANHSTALGAFNTTSWAIDHKVPVPIMFVCEDNNIAISVPTPNHWIHKQFKIKPNLHYIECDGLNLADVYRATRQGHDLAKKGQPVFLHMRLKRLLGHAGSDIEFHYHDLSQVEQVEQEDPLLHTARTLESLAWMHKDEIIAQYEMIREQIQYKAAQVISKPRLTSAREIMRPIIPPKSKLPKQKIPDESARKKIFASAYDSLNKPKNLCQNINCALTDLLLQYPKAVVFGEDVGKKGGVYRVTQGLQAKFSQARVFDTLLDEQTILGTAIGMGHNGLLPIPEIQFLAYTHNAADQIRGEAATLSFFSNGQYTNPMVIRIPGLAYQKGFGGHFHNDNALGFLREIPGLIIACPSRASDGARLLRECFKLAYEQQRVVVFVEPIALYMTKDLYETGDHKALEAYPHPKEVAPYAQVRTEGDGTDIALISYGNGAYLCRQAMQVLQSQGVKARLIDLRWLHPLPAESLLKAIAGVGRVLIVDECRQTGSLSEEIVSWFLEHVQPLPKIKRLTAKDCFIPIGRAWQHLLPSKEKIIQSVSDMVEHAYSHSA